MSSSPILRIPNLPAGSTTGQTLRWDATKWVANSDLIVTDTGNVGIGTTTPGTARLNVQHTGTNPLVLQNTAGITARVQMDTTSGTVRYGNLGGNFVVDTGANAERMRIDATGNVGIGTSTPDSLLHLSLGGTTDQGEVAMAIGNDSVTARQARIVKNTSSPYELKIRSKADAGGSGVPITFETKLDGEDMRLDGSGNLLVGTTTSPDNERLRVHGSSVGTGRVAGFYDSAGTELLTVWGNGGVRFPLALPISGIVYSTGGFLTSTDPSDANLKTNVQVSPYGLAEVMALNPVSFNWKEDDGLTHFGFIAQEVEPVIPEIFQTESPAGSDESWCGLRSSEIVPVLVKAIQELNAKVDALT